MIDQAKLLFSPIKSRRTFEEVSNEIKRLILQGILKPGDKLPSENELARRFSVGRQTIREGLRLLELSGFITVQKGSTGGSLIEDTIPNRISSLFLDAIQMKNISVDELTLARLEIERVVLNHTLNNIEDSDLKNLQENIVQAKKMVENYIPAFNQNIQFHKLLAKASKNFVFVIVVEAIMAVVAHFLSGYQNDVEGSRKIALLHQDILNAITEGKRDEAMRLLEEDLQQLKRVL